MRYSGVRIFWASLLVFISICFNSCSQSIDYNKGGTDAKNYYQEIPYEMINGKLFIQVTINQRTARFLLDTGAPTQLTPDLAKELNSLFLNSIVATDANGNKDSLNLVELNTISLGKISFTNVPALIVANELYDCWKIEGVIGSNLLRNAIVKIAPVKKVLILTDNEQRLGLNKSHSAKLNLLRNKQSSPILKIDLNNRVNLEVEFDSGDNGFLLLSPQHMQQLGRFGAFNVIEKGFGAVHRSIYGLQKMDSTYRLVFPTVTVAGVTFKHAAVETIANTTPRLGTTLLQYGAVTLDYKHGKFYFDPNSSNIDLTEKQWPVDFTTQGEKLIAGVVWGNLQNQITPGDHITAINDVPFPKTNLCQWLNGKPILENVEQVTLTIKNTKGEIRKVQITKQ
ncbi:retropepsin-like aspartic protease [Mucilaginibacter sp. PAMB04274]|uniref:retropepsin-like aspartic protease n=1 Tax=Mucilaginibacter sp. PAMB04274 TaxID=3138568 RepID=UPI0031F685F1